jgi:mRNA interferase YafQ
MTYTIKTTRKFEKDLKLAVKRGKKLELLSVVIKTLAAGKKLAPKYKDHILNGNFADVHECHIQPDWLLLYEIYEEELLLYLTRTGSHSDLF